MDPTNVSAILFLHTLCTACYLYPPRVFGDHIHWGGLPTIPRGGPILVLARQNAEPSGGVLSGGTTLQDLLDHEVHSVETRHEQQGKENEVSPLWRRLQLELRGHRL